MAQIQPTRSSLRNSPTIAALPAPLPPNFAQNNVFVPAAGSRAYPNISLIATAGQLPLLPAPPSPMMPDVRLVPPELFFELLDGVYEYITDWPDIIAYKETSQIVREVYDNYGPPPAVPYNYYACEQKIIDLLKKHGGLSAEIFAPVIHIILAAGINADDSIIISWRLSQPELYSSATRETYTIDLLSFFRRVFRTWEFAGSTLPELKVMRRAAKTRMRGFPNSEDFAPFLEGKDDVEIERIGKLVERLLEHLRRKRTMHNHGDPRFRLLAGVERDFVATRVLRAMWAEQAVEMIGRMMAEGVNDENWDQWEDTVKDYMDMEVAFGTFCWARGYDDEVRGIHGNFRWRPREPKLMKEGDSDDEDENGDGRKAGNDEGNDNGP
ncbi:hypothetical protein BJ508DRAFT_311151 [Ascobolus immersus RN42]|uniref:Uncharacterized protein n=1 Tax=Ascobolus immersus RN42 TaxID=1160509 RepID=A0A3N4HTI3_ASCIM|nr:hypothetical protein BJ508DRAFT_311151 [Ascobolus immersus RN42]